ncbi:MAG: glycosyltransferase, partial [Chryseobacterium sp.]
MNPLVTIVIPVYKVEKFIERCLQSVVSQTYKNIECILVNDVTPDASMDIAEKF